ncbi:hypothetical protein DQ237_06465 [Blastococcus sp. TF02-8]|uniref:hypothetical protein n=1 Tax=Blastococcus sp. TF02-8 TaxID=2250574 RepID=UPI000DEB17A0|nr:hypothetical protein [Blastococcus sp. TF02-8]RBY97212.1 hypothetical protein DQ237_06465 [Blastococcus sp. TF02-8]
MGRHTAAEDGSADPLVAAALAQRAGGAAGVHRGEAAADPREGDLGWPAAPQAPEPDDGGSVGWPGGGSSGEDAAAPRSGRGWRRMFRSRAAA